MYIQNAIITHVGGSSSSRDKSIAKIKSRNILVFFQTKFLCFEQAQTAREATRKVQSYSTQEEKLMRIKCLQFQICFLKGKYLRKNNNQIKIVFKMYKSILQKF